MIQEHQETKDTLIKLRANTLGDWDTKLRSENRRLSFNLFSIKKDLNQTKDKYEKLCAKYTHLRERNDELKREQTTLQSLIGVCDKMFEEFNKKEWDAKK